MRDCRHSQMAGVTICVGQWSRRRPKRSRRRRFGFWPDSESLEPRVLLAVLYVDIIDHNGEAANDGSSWYAAYTNLETGLDAAASGDEVRVADGVYKPSGDRTATFQLRTGVALSGGYAGYGGINADERDLAGHPSILSGEIGTVAAHDNVYHVVTGSGVDATAVLDGFTIRDAYASGGSVLYGGGLCNDHGSPTVRNCTFTANYAIHGGAIGNIASSPRIESCVFDANTCSYDGGAIGNYEASAPLVIACTFTGNVAAGAPGGAIYNAASSPVIRQCEFIGNSAGNTGGAMSSRGQSEPVVVGCTFTHNRASGSGGAIYSHQSPNWNNTAYRAHYTNCTFLGNTTSGSGGAVCNVFSNIVFNNCVFSGNEARQSGGGMSNEYYSSSRLVNCTFAGNRADQQTNSSGGAFFNYYYSAPILSNCILWGNIGRNGNSIVDSTASATTVDYSDVEGGWAGAGEHNIHADPRFVQLPSAGADGDWGTSDDQYGDLRLRDDSPCIDAASNAAVRSDLADVDGDGDVAEPLPLDHDGNARFIDVPSVPDTGAGVAPIVDMGACEASEAAPGITLPGGAGADHFYVRLSPDGTTLQIWSGTAAIDEPDWSYPLASTPSCTFDTAGGEDSLTVDFRNGPPIPTAGLHFQAGDGRDALVLTNTSGDASLDVTVDELLYGVHSITCAQVEERMLGGDGNIHLDSLSVLGDEAAALTLSIQAAGGRALFARTLAISGAAAVDLNDNDLVLRAGDDADAVLERVAGWIASARNTLPLWQGTGGLSSSAAREHDTPMMGLAAIINREGTAALHETFDGEPVDGGCVLVKYTFNGDTDANGRIDGDDYFRVDRGFLAGGTHYCDGDLDYDACAHGPDYFLIDLAFMSQMPLLPAVLPAGATAAPQPLLSHPHLNDDEAEWRRLEDVF